MSTDHHATRTDIWAGSNLARHEASPLTGKQYLTVVAHGDVSVRETAEGLDIIVQRGDIITTIVLPITREQLCDLACGLWIEDMAEAQQ